MKKAIFLLLDEYADWEGSYLASALNQSDTWEVMTASIQDEVRSMGGLTTLIDVQLEAVNAYDLLVLIGGISWHIDNQILNHFVQQAFEQHKPIAAICGAVDYLARQGHLNTYRHTGNAVQLLDQYENYQPTYPFIATQVVRDKHLVTANGTAAIPFTAAVQQLIDFDSNDNIERQAYMNQFGFYDYCERYGNPYL